MIDLVHHHHLLNYQYQYYDQVHNLILIHLINISLTEIMDFTINLEENGFLIIRIFPLNMISMIQQYRQLLHLSLSNLSLDSFFFFGIK